jgi:hypothetical protein
VSENPVWRLRVQDPDTNETFGQSVRIEAPSKAEAREKFQSRDPYNVYVYTAEGGSTWQSVWAHSEANARAIALNREDRYRGTEEVERVEVPDDYETQVEFYIGTGADRPDGHSSRGEQA